MIRSLDYAATSALNRIARAPEEFSKFEGFLDKWRAQATAAFLAGVRETRGAGRLWPEDEVAGSQLLRFFVVEKAIYEIGYELSNRPDWMSVPISGALRALFSEGSAA
jgi:maltose alpha-D-glucosyltransferase / alpha-amylase